VILQVTGFTGSLSCKGTDRTEGSMYCQLLHPPLQRFLCLTDIKCLINAPLIVSLRNALPSNNRGIMCLRHIVNASPRDGKGRFALRHQWTRRKCNKEFHHFEQMRAVGYCYGRVDSSIYSAHDARINARILPM
jgi:hypothetical protein